MDEFLRYFYEGPEREYHVRELARLTKKSPTTVSKYLKTLEKKGLIFSIKKYNHLFFRANNEDKNFKEKKIFYYIQKIRKVGLIEYLNEILNHPQAIILFGSFSKGESIKESDLDILIISPLKKDLDLEKFERKLKHKIQLFIHSSNEVEKMKIKNKELLNNFVNGILLEGYWEVLK